MRENEGLLQKPACSLLARAVLLVAALVGRLKVRIVIDRFFSLCYSDGLCSRKSVFLFERKIG